MEKMMTRFNPAAVAAASLAATIVGTLALSAAPALAATTCIDTRNIRESHQVENGKALIFTMRNGTVYRNNLKGACPDLVFNGYVWVIRNPDNTVCDNEETIKVLRSGEICQIGTFDKQPAKTQAPG